MPDTLPSESVTRTPFAGNRHAKVAYFISHPIQYQAPLLRRISQEPDIDLKVFFSSDLSVRGYVDSGFGVQVKWDIPLLDGYAYEFLPRVNDGDTIGFATPLNWGVFRRLRAGGFDAIWVFGYNRLVCLQAIVAAKVLGIPVILRVESNLRLQRSPLKLAAKRLFFHLLRPGVACVVPIGKHNRAYWQYYWGENFPAFPMPYAVDNEFFQRKSAEAAPHREAFRQALGLRPGMPIILYASKLQARKRCIDLVDAFLRLAAESGGEPPACLLIVGDGEERAAIEARVRASGTPHIRMLGFRNQTELPAFYDLCDVFVLPSLSETWGLVVNEVMNAGRPIVVSDQVGCQPDLVQDGFNGFVFPAGDVDGLTACLRRLVHSAELRESMGRNSRRLIQEYGFEQDVEGLRAAVAHVVPGFALSANRQPGDQST